MQPQCVTSIVPAKSVTILYYVGMDKGERYRRTVFELGEKRKMVGRIERLGMKRMKIYEGEGAAVRREETEEGEQQSSFFLLTPDD